MSEHEDQSLVWPNGEMVTVESVEGYTEDARVVAHPLDDAQILTPDWVISQLTDVSRWAARMPKLTAKAEALKKDRKRELDAKRAQAVLDVAKYPVREHSARVTLAIAEERRAYDRAAVAFEEARRVGNLLSDYTSRLQSIGKQVELVYRGEGRQ
ncbi:hypothetical protein [Microbacterium plantarum]|uniref:hypothetical protein n=1 Tax=Microbacterium plantarum TaxID=1816425 RepID=UPI002B48C2CA|nr:hypothetical protein [Microbacterium plantarum]WRK16147.1 hypothetical protein VC184_09455 [Microbacterium plantarum]